MTTVAQRITETPIAPYLGVLRAMTREEKQIVVMFLIETMDGQESDVDEMRKKLNVPESSKTKWFREHATLNHEWNRQEAWNRLTDEQREEAAHLNLTAEDMDERTFYIIQKHLK